MTDIETSIFEYAKNSTITCIDALFFYILQADSNADQQNTVCALRTLASNYIVIIFR